MGSTVSAIHDDHDDYQHLCKKHGVQAHGIYSSQWYDHMRELEELDAKVIPQHDPSMTGQTDYERIEGDFYPTPSENLYCLAHFYKIAGMKVWEPACGEGHLSKPMIELGCDVLSTDLYHRGYGSGDIDFLKVNSLPAGVEAIITNPPFGDEAELFLRKAAEFMKPVDGFVALFLRNEYDCATKRNELFGGNEYYAGKIVVQKRPRWIEGSKGSPRHNYAWYIWNFAPETALTQPNIFYIHPKDADRP